MLFTAAPIGNGHSGLEAECRKILCEALPRNAPERANRAAIHQSRFGLQDVGVDTQVQNPHLLKEERGPRLLARGLEAFALQLELPGDFKCSDDLRALVAVAYEDFLRHCEVAEVVEVRQPD